MPARRRVPRLAWIGVAILSTGLAVALAVRQTRTPGPTTASASSAAVAPAGATRLVVLPFQNLGDSSDAYFAEGIADELRAKLSGLPGLEVIARGSSI